MNLGISTQGNTWKRIKKQNIVAAAGIALAVSALATGVVLRDTTPSGGPIATSPASISRQAPVPQTFIYLVGSQEQAAELTAGFANAAVETGADALRQAMVIDSPEAEASLQTMLGELSEAGTAGSVNIVDVRPGAPSAGALESRSNVAGRQRLPVPGRGLPELRGSRGEQRAGRQRLPVPGRGLPELHARHRGLC